MIELHVDRGEPLPLHVQLLEQVRYHIEVGAWEPGYRLPTVRFLAGSLGVNYGTENVRFPAPVTVGSRIRGSGELVSVEDVKGGVQAVVRVTVEIEGKDKPACVVDTISRYYAAA